MVLFGPISPPSTSIYSGAFSGIGVEFPFPYQTIDLDDGTKMKLYDDAMTEIDRLITKDNDLKIDLIKKIINKYKQDVIKLEIFKNK